MYVKNTVWGPVFLLFSALTFSQNALAKKITLMSYNVENLFDTFHDEGKEDYTYLPKWVKRQNPDVYPFCKSIKVYHWRQECFNIDWTIEKLNKKLDSLTKVIQTVNRGKGPDILALQEVENLNVLNAWMKRGLAEMGYKEVVLIEGPDKRGIDGAIISKFPLAQEPTYHEFLLKLSWDQIQTTLFASSLERDLGVQTNVVPKRGILEAVFSVGKGKELSVLTNHWPSQANPATERYEIAKILNNVAVKADAEGRALVSLGDYNTTESDSPNGLNEWIFNKRRKVHFYDARAEYLIEAGSNAKNLPGTHWYRGHYAALDKILVLESTAGQIQPNWLSYKVIAEDFMMIEADRGPYKLKPHRFNFHTAEGYSDHLPITLDLKL
jgi:endonuclease/exonuclease/phosphatase family metal-dependent hydrolase